jgi:hypothetical protein
VINLAGSDKSDAHIAVELCKAGAVIQMTEQYGEARASLMGIVGAFTLRRAWYYWVAEGPMPLDLARAMYDHQVGRTDVRVAGHCMRPHPDSWARHYTPSGALIILDNDGKQERKFRQFVERGELKDDDGEGFVFAREIPGDARSFVETYHIDTQEGLNLFVEFARRASALPVSG